MPWVLGFVVVSMLSGAFSSMLGLDIDSMARRGMTNEPTTAVSSASQGAGNWFDPGWQKNEESGGTPADPNETTAAAETGAAAQIETENDEAETIEVVDISNKAKGAETKINSNEVEKGNTVNVLAH